MKNLFLAFASLAFIATPLTLVSSPVAAKTATQKKNEAKGAQAKAKTVAKSQASKANSKAKAAQKKSKK
ncbi:MAG: hypothetical protein RLZZ502_249 [Pseudomonadota bacterium]|jgi:hypothetical protein